MSKDKYHANLSKVIEKMRFVNQKNKIKRKIIKRKTKGKGKNQ